MKYFKTLLWIAYLLSIVSLIVGIIAKMSGFVVFGLTPPSYLFFTGICLLYAIAFNLTQISLTQK